MTLRFKIVSIIAIAAIAVSFTYKEEPTAELNWHTWNTGYPKVRSEKKIGLIDVYTDWCGWCKRMDKDTYAKKEIIEKINKDFVPIKFNPEAQGVYYLDSTAYSGPQLYAMISEENASGFPSTYFLIPQGNKIFKVGIAGYHGAESFSQVLDQVLSIAQGNSK